MKPGVHGGYESTETGPLFRKAVDEVRSEDSPSLDEMLDWQARDPERWMRFQDEAYALEGQTGTPEHSRFMHENPEVIRSRYEWRRFDRVRFKVRHGIERTPEEERLIHEALTVRKSRHYRDAQLLEWLSFESEEVPR